MSSGNAISMAMSPSNNGTVTDVAISSNTMPTQTSNAATELTNYNHDVIINASMAIGVPYKSPFNDITVWMTGMIIFSFFVIGFTLNLLTVLVIAKFPQLRNIFVIFIFSLCISDLISAMISPIYWYHRTLGFDRFEIPDFFCRFYWAADLMTSFATALHIVSFGMLRYFSIKFPFWHQRITKQIAKIFVVGIWAVTFACAFIPFSIWFGAQEIDRNSDDEFARWPVCTILPEWYSTYKIYQKIAYPLFLYAPILIVVLISILTAIEVFSNTKSTKATVTKVRRRKDRQAVLQLILIVVSFLIGYLPFTAYEYWSVEEEENTPHIRSVDYYFGTTEYILIRFSECLNPIFYNLGSSRMRRCTMKYLRQLVGKADRRSRTISILSEKTTGDSRHRGSGSAIQSQDPSVKGPKATLDSPI